MHVTTLYTDARDVRNVLTPFVGASEPRPIAPRIYARDRGAASIARVFLDGRDVTNEANWVEPKSGRVGVYVRSRKGEPTGRIRIRRGTVTFTYR